MCNTSERFNPSVRSQLQEWFESADDLEKEAMRKAFYHFLLSKRAVPAASAARLSEQLWSLLNKSCGIRLKDGSHVYVDEEFVFMIKNTQVVRDEHGVPLIMADLAENASKVEDLTVEIGRELLSLNQILDVAIYLMPPAERLYAIGCYAERFAKEAKKLGPVKAKRLLIRDLFFDCGSRAWMILEKIVVRALARIGFEFLEGRFKG